MVALLAKKERERERGEPENFIFLGSRDGLEHGVERRD